jgi:hypothetical protein
VTRPRRMYCDECWREVNNQMRGKKKDANHDEIAEYLEKAGLLVEDMSAVGRGVPDLLVAYRNVIKMVEIKNKKTSYGRKGLNGLQRKLVDRGFPVCVVRSLEEAAEFVSLLKGCKTEDELEAVSYGVSRPEQLDTLKAEMSR